MKLEEYKKKAVQRLNKSIAFDSKENMYYACMGVIEETGEIIAELRKPLFKGNFHEKLLDKEEIKSELGDLMWYISLICKNTNINMNEFKKNEEQKNQKLSTRENLIQTSIKMGQHSGKIVEEYQRFFIEKNNKKLLVREIEMQYNDICKLAENLDFTIDEILNKNIKKINSRYNENGDSTR